jgi:DNA-binding transcriptional MerR regulator
MTDSYSISDLAREFAVTTRTIRFYEDQGLFRLKLALRGKRLGFSLAEIRELFELYDVSRDEKKQLEEFLVRLERRRALLEQQREDIEVMLNEIDFFANQCRRLLKGEPSKTTT